MHPVRTLCRLNILSNISKMARLTVARVAHCSDIILLSVVQSNGFPSMNAVRPAPPLNTEDPHAGAAPAAAGPRLAGILSSS